MAGRSTDDLGDEELDPVEADPDADFEPDEDVLDDDLDPAEELADDLDDDLDDDLVDEAAGGLDPELAGDVPVDDDLDDDDEVAILPTFDEDEEELVRAVVDDDDDTDLDTEGLREGEFVCRSCYMAKRESALADPKRMLCRDCA